MSASGFFVANERKGPIGAAALAVAPVGLPCLYSNNCIEDGPAEVNKLTGGHKRMAFVLAYEIQGLARQFGIEKLGFLTLTFADRVHDIREAQKRFHSLNTNVLRGRYSRAIGVWERQKSGRLHFHLVVVLGADIRSGFDFGAIERCDYRSASRALRSEWAFWRKTAPLYGFGRTELLPIKSTGEGIARYVGKYVSKHIGQRDDEDKGARVVRFIGFKPCDRLASARFAWVTENSWLWRQKLAAYARRIGAKDTDALKRIFGPRWAYLLQAEIMAERIDVEYPSLRCALEGGRLSSPMDRARLQAACYLDRRTFSKHYTIRQL